MPWNVKLVGEGWRLALRARRRLRLLGAALMAALVTVLAAEALLFLIVGHRSAAAAGAALTVGFAPLAFGMVRSPGPPTPMTIDGEHGLMLRTRRLRGTVAFAFAVLCACAMVLGGVLVVGGIVRRDAGPVALGVLALLLSWLFAACMMSVLRSRRIADRGLLLLPDAVVMRVHPAVTRRIDWSEIAGVRTHWRRGLQPVPRRSERIRNWLTFVPHDGVTWTPDLLGVFSRTIHPSLNPVQLAVPPYAALGLVQFYIANPEARDELADSRSLVRFDQIARSTA